MLHSPAKLAFAARAGLPALGLLVGLAAPWDAAPAIAQPAATDPAATDPTAACAGLSLADIAAAAGLSFVHERGGTGRKHLVETSGSGLAWLDYDGDGLVDLYVVQSGPFPEPAAEGETPAAAGGEASRDRLFRNLGGGRFEDVTERAGAGDTGYGMGAVAVDLTGDRLPELLVTNFGDDRLWVNRGDGTLAPAGAEGVGAGLVAGSWSSSSAFADADADGDLDAYIARYALYDPATDLFCGDPATGERTYCDPSLFPGAPDRFFRNLGGGRFADATAEAGLAGADGRGLGVVFVDLDGDRLPDLYVANDLTPNFLFKNRGDGTFEDLSLLSGTAVNREGKPEAGMGIGVGDVDGDGDPDIAVTNFDVETNTLYSNLGDLFFEDSSAPSGFGVPSFNLLGFGLALADLDLDGDLDAYAANGHIFEQPRREGVSYAQPDLLLLGDGRGGFAPARCGPAFSDQLVGRGLAAADFDNDGDLDLAISNSGGPLQLLDNGLLDRRGAVDASAAGVARWVGVRLVGAAPNSDAVGARVTLISRASGEDGGSAEADASDPGEPYRQPRWVQAGDSFQSGSDKRLLFGLPAGHEPVALEVVWPSGQRRRLAAPPLGGYLSIVE